MSTNNPTAARYDGESPVFNHEPVQVASHGTYIGILSQATVAQIQQPKVYYFITDHLGTPMKMTDESGAVVWSSDYKPFGEVLSGVSTIQNHFRFPGQYFDREIGLHYNYSRYYHTRVGSYLTADPTGVVHGINHLYLYSWANPLKYIDPFGLAPGDVYLFRACTFHRSSFPWTVWSCGHRTPRGKNPFLRN